MVICAGVGRPAQVTTITIACFLTMCVTIYQGVINVDETLIKAARVLGAKDRDIFVRVIAPATLPFITDGHPPRRLRRADHPDRRREHRRHRRPRNAHPLPEQHL